MFGENLIKWREIKSISQRELAERIGGSQSTIVSIEAGRQNPSEELMRRIAEAIDVPFAMLVDEKGLIGKASYLEELYKDDPETLEFLANSKNKEFILLAKDACQAGVPPEDLEALVNIMKKNKTK